MGLNLLKQKKVRLKAQQHLLQEINLVVSVVKILPNLDTIMKRSLEEQVLMILTLKIKV